MEDTDYVLCVSGGNDSIALIRFAIESGLKRWSVLYNDTGWARDDWPARMAQVRQWVESLGANYFETKSEGMEAMARRKKGWPMPASKIQFCTGYLKEEPTQAWLDKVDPDRELTCVNGVRREESQNRADAPEWVAESSKHGGRELWSPLVRVETPERNRLIEATPFEVLPHQSMECWPCICANKKDLKLLATDPDRIDRIEAIEIDMGFTRNKKPRTMFRPYRVGGGVGIRQAVEWGCGKHGHKSAEVPLDYRYVGQTTYENASDIAYEPDTPQGREFDRQCSAGFCGA